MKDHPQSGPVNFLGSPGHIYGRGWGSPPSNVSKTSVEPSPGPAVYSSGMEATGGREKARVLPSGAGVAVSQKVLFPAEPISLQWNQDHHIGAGLCNLGNTCFLNAALQCLSYTAPLANYMLSQEHLKTCQKFSSCMMCAMQDHVIQIFANSGSVVIPAGVLSELQQIAVHFQLGRQEDSHEFLQYIIGAMQMSCLPGYNLSRQTQAATFVHRVFGGFLRSRVRCLNCTAVYDTYDVFMDLALRIETTESITQALRQFVKHEILDGENAYNCRRCERKVPALKRLSIHKASNVLAISLSRFANYSGGKITKNVRYPEILDMRPYMFRSHGEPLIYCLYAVLVHSGFSCHTGHYYCYIKTSSGQWYLMDDASVTRSDIRTVLSQQAYVLFYIRCPDVKDGKEAKRSDEMPGQSSQHQKPFDQGYGVKHSKKRLRPEEDREQGCHTQDGDHGGARQPSRQDQHSKEHPAKRLKKSNLECNVRDEYAVHDARIHPSARGPPVGAARSTVTATTTR